VKMGITNNDVMEADTGVNVTGAYANFASERIIIKKTGNDSFLINGCACFYKDETARNTNKAPILMKKYSVTKTKGQLENPYTSLYTNLKLDYTNSSDNDA